MINRTREIVSISDKENKNIHDEVTCTTSDGQTFGKPRKGFVSIVDKATGEYLIKDKPCDFGGTGKNNLILWNGREIIPQILFDQNRNAGSGQKDLKIRWLSVGTGGADAVHPLDPVAPKSEDVGPYSEIVLDAGNSNYVAGRKKPFDTSVSFIQDDENDNRWLIAQVTTTLLYAEGNTNDINEAVIWMSNSSNPTLATQMEAFARVTFSTIRKHPQRELVFLWYFYF